MFYFISKKFSYEENYNSMNNFIIIILDRYNIYRINYPAFFAFFKKITITFYICLIGIISYINYFISVKIDFLFILFFYHKFLFGKDPFKKFIKRDFTGFKLNSKTWGKKIFNNKEKINYLKIKNNEYELWLKKFNKLSEQKQKLQVKEFEFKKSQVEQYKTEINNLKKENLFICKFSEHNIFGEIYKEKDMYILECYSLTSNKSYVEIASTGKKGISIKVGEKSDTGYQGYANISLIFRFKTKEELLNIIQKITDEQLLLTGLSNEEWLNLCNNIRENINKQSERQGYDFNKEEIIQLNKYEKFNEYESYEQFIGKIGEGVSKLTNKTLLPPKD